MWMIYGLVSFIDRGVSLGGSNSVAVALGDVDGDGDLDAFVTNYNIQANKLIHICRCRRFYACSTRLGR